MLETEASLAKMIHEVVKSQIQMGVIPAGSTNFLALQLQSIELCSALNRTPKMERFVVEQDMLPEAQRDPRYFKVLEELIMQQPLLLMRLENLYRMVIRYKTAVMTEIQRQVPQLVADPDQLIEALRPYQELENMISSTLIKNNDDPEPIKQKTQQEVYAEVSLKRVAPTRYTPTSSGKAYQSYQQ